ncbi:MAG: FecR domain-containing protein [Bacteroidia bacterium]|nr:FecR domain-containing protein [Bacteroidia bacterium]
MVSKRFRHKTYKQLLKDNAFLQWRFSPTPETDKYWEELQITHPGLVIEIDKADRYLKKRYFNALPLSSEDEHLLLERIVATLQISTQKKHILHSWIKYVAASVALVLTIGLAYYLVFPQPEISQENIIIGKELNSLDIQLIANNQTTSFQENIAIEIDADGTAQVKTDDSADEKIVVNVEAINTLIVPYGKRSTLTLSDGSKVWLNSGSVLEFPAQFTDKNREIRLASGEMYIEVAPDKRRSFYVHTSNFNVKVYGTKFNISNYSGASKSVVLVEGRISLQSLNKQETFLSPNEYAVYSDNGTFNTKKVDVNQFISWKNGYLEFNKTPMTEVLKQIGRYYNLSFNFNNDVNLQKRNCTGKIYLSENLDNVMTTVGLLSSTKYIKENNQIFITNDPN